jgi:hypothetical protein
MAEADLYEPIKAFLEAWGYEVKGEIGPADVVAVRGEDVIAVELKERLTLALVLQAVDRLAVADAVYVGFRIGSRSSATWRSHRRQVIGLLRRLGIGLLTVSSRDHVVAVLDPAPYRPRVSAHRRARLVREFQTRIGDPETGGSRTRQRLTAYRQDSIRCARALLDGPLTLKVLRDRTGVDRAGPILRDDYYGWFERVGFGTYALTTKGSTELSRWDEADGSVT